MQNLSLLRKKKALLSLSQAKTPQVRTKLVFDAPILAKNGGDTDGPNSNASVNMNIDDDATVVVGTEVFKRKQGDVPPLTKGDRKIRIIGKNISSPISSNISAAAAKQLRRAP